MSQRVLDEREHRRGLVLGLTLAEILILLLFMLLLALGVRLKEIEERRRVGDEIIKIIKPILPEGHKQSAEALAPVFAGVREFIEATGKIDPNAPPEWLKRVRRILKGPESGPKSPLAPAPGNGVIKRNPQPPGEDPGSNQGGAGITTGTLPGPKGAHDWPPIITLSEASGYFFATGSADVTPDFQAKLSTEVVDRLVKTISEYRVDVIEVVGHTDERSYNVRPAQPEPLPDSTPSKFLLRRSPRMSNLDTTLIPYLKGAPERLVAADNAGLGLARAASVARILAKDLRLANVRILPLSGGQLVLVDDILSPGSPGDTKERRRIEIRARRSNKLGQPWEGRVKQDALLEPRK